MSASMGAGHDGAARELSRRLESEGHNTRVVDLLDAPPLRIGPVFRIGYEAQLRFAPWAYQLTYRLWYRLPFLIGPVTRFVNAIAGRRLLKWIREFNADVVVSTYPLASLALGRRRQKGKLAIPVVTYITDFAVHPLLVHKFVDLHLCVHPQSAVKAAGRVPGRVAAPGPLVAPRFFSRRPSVAEARRRVGLRPDARAVLIVAGSWGVGDVVETFDVLSRSDKYTPVVVCGRNAPLAEQLRARGGGLVFGWTDDMPLLMRACDAVVQNAGGLTCMEAFASGVPVLSFRPIPGHGVENAEDMHAAGVAAYVRDPIDLVPTLDVVTGGQRTAMRSAAKAMFAGDAAAEARDAQSLESLTPLRPRRSRVAISIAGVAAFYATFTVGVGVAAAHGVGVSRVPRHSDNVFIAVRVSGAAARDAAVENALARLGVSAVVDGQLARQDTEAITKLSNAGVEVVNGGTGHRVRIRAERAEEDVAGTGRAIGRATGERCLAFVPNRRVNGYDLVAARLTHEKVVVGPTILKPGDNDVLRLRAGRVYVIDGRSVDPAELVAALDALGATAASYHVVPAPVSSS